MSDLPLIGDILNSLINGDVEYLDQHQTKIEGRIKKEHYDYIGAGIWDQIKSYVQYAKSTGAEWVAVVIEKIYTAFETIGEWLSQLNEKYFVRVTMKFWKNLTRFTTDMISATTSTVVSLFNTFTSLFMKLFTKSLGLFIPATDFIKKWVREITSLITVNAVKAAGILVEPFKIIGSLIKTHWIPLFMFKQSTLVNGACLALANSVCAIVAQSYNVDAYFHLASAYELYGKSITLARTLEIYDKEHLDGNNTHHQKFVNRILQIGKYASRSFPNSGLVLNMPTALLLQLQESWRAHLQDESLVIRTNRDLLKYGTKIIETYYLNQDASWWKEVASAIFEARVMKDTLNIVVSFLHTKYCPVAMDTFPADTVPLPNSSLKTQMAQYNRRLDKDPKIVEILKVYGLLNETREDAKSTLDDSARSALLRETLDTLELQHEFLEAHKVKQLQRDRVLSTLHSDNEKLAVATLDSSDVASATAKIVALQFKFEDYKFLPDGKDTEFIQAVTSKNFTPPIADKLLSASHYKGIQGDIEHWKQSRRDSGDGFLKYLAGVEHEITHGNPVPNFCDKPGNTLTPAMVERYGKGDGERYILFQIYSKIHAAKKSEKKIFLQQIYDDLNLALDRYDRIMQFLAYDNKLYYLGFAMGFSYLLLELAISYTGMLKPVNPFITKNALKGKRSDIVDVKTTLRKIDALQETDPKNLNAWNNSLIKHLNETRVTVDGQEGGLDTLKQFVAELDTLSANADSLNRANYAWKARFSAEFLDQVMDRNLKDMEGMLQGAQTKPNAYFDALTFKKEDEFNNMALYINNLSKFTSKVLFPLFPELSVYNANVTDPQSKEYFPRLQMLHKSIQEAAIKKSDENLDIRPELYLSRSQPSSSSTVKGIDKPLKHFNAYNTVLLNNLLTQDGFFEETITNLDLALNVQTSIVVATDTLNALNAIAESPLSTVGEYQAQYNDSPMINDALTLIFKNNNPSDTLTNFVETQALPLKNTIDALTSFRDNLETLVRVEGTAPPNIVEGRLDDLMASMAVFSKAFFNAEEGEKYQELLKTNSPKSQSEFEIYQKAKITAEALSKLQKRMTDIFASDDYSNELYSTAKQRIDFLSDCIDRVNPSTAQNQEFIETKQNVQPYLVYQHTQGDKSLSALHDLLKEATTVLGNSEHTLDQQLDLTRRILFLMDEKQARIVQAAFIQHMSAKRSQTQSVALVDGLEIVSAHANKLFNTKDDRYFHENLADAMNAVPGVIMDDGTVAYDPQHPLSQTIFQSLDRMRQKFMYSQGITEQRVKTLFQISSRDDAYTEMMLGMTQFITAMKYPYATSEEVVAHIYELRKTMFEDYTSPSPKIHIATFNVEKFMRDNWFTLKASEHILSGAAFISPYTVDSKEQTFKLLEIAAGPATNTALDAALLPTAGKSFVNSALIHRFSNHLLTLLKLSNRENRLLKLQQLKELNDENELSVALQRDGYRGTLEQMEADFLDISTNEKLRGALQQARSHEEFFSVFTANMFKCINGVVISDPSLQKNINDLLSMADIDLGSRVGESFFVSELTNDTYALAKTAVAEMKANRDDWLVTENRDLYDLAYSDFFFFFMDEMIAYQDLLGEYKGGFNSKVMDGIHHDYVSTIFYQKLQLKLDELLVGREGNVMVSPHVTSALQGLSVAFRDLSLNAQYRYKSNFDIYSISDVTMPQAIEEFGIFNQDTVSQMNASLPILRKQLKQRVDDTLFGTDWSWNIFASGKKYFFGENLSTFDKFKRIGYRTLEVAHTGIFWYSVSNSTQNLYDTVANLQSLPSMFNTLSAIVTGSSGTGLISARRLPANFRYVEGNTVFSDFAKLNTERMIISNQDTTLFRKIRRHLQHMFKNIFNWDSDSNLYTWLQVIGAAAISIDYSFSFMKQMMQLMYHWVESDVFFSYDVPLPSSALTWCLLGASATFFIGDKIFSNSLRIYNRLNNDNLFSSFPSLTAHHTGQTLFRSIVHVFGFVKGIARIYEALPIYTAPVTSSSTEVSTFLADKATIDKAMQARDPFYIFSSNIKNTISYTDPLWLARMGYSTLSVGSSTQTIYQFFKPGGYDLLDAFNMFWILLTTQYKDIPYRLDSKFTTLSFKKIDSNDVNKILSTDGILWMTSEDIETFIRLYKEKPDDQKRLFVDFYNMGNVYQVVRRETTFIEASIHGIMTDPNIMNVLKALNKTENNIQLIEFASAFILRYAIQYIISLS